LAYNWLIFVALQALNQYPFMAKYELIMPKMGESIMEATILNWSKKEGDRVELDETILEIATDKVDSEIPSPVEGVIKELLFQENDVVEIGKVIAIIETEQGQSESAGNGVSSSESKTETQPQAQPEPPVESPAKPTPEPASAPTELPARSSDRFYSPLVRNIASKEGVSIEELDAIQGSGLKGRVTKADLLAFLENRQQPKAATPRAETPSPQSTTPDPSGKAPTGKTDAGKYGPDVEIIEMGRMRKMISEHMVHSKHTSPHVTSFVEADVTTLVQWREKVKKSFQDKYDEKITYTPIFIDAVVKALKDYPMVNISVDGDKLVRKKRLNIGMAAALPSGNLIVPVIHDAEQYNLIGLTKKVNDLAARARGNKLKPEEIQGGSFTITNVGTFGNVMGTPIINQPQVAILATGAIRKKPAVLETEYGDVIAIRQMMYLSLSYDHRVVDGMLGGSFLRRIADYLEDFDADQAI
jgi:2-oxoglutarate dehydrogenase E2 component (dihydrolipoamide succinyltransferase)